MPLAKGFAIVETMIALLISAILSFSIYLLSIYVLSATQQSLTKQLLTQGANDLSNQLYTATHYCATTSLSVIAGCVSGSSVYQEISYGAHVAANSSTCCLSVECSELELANCRLTNWKYALKNKNNLPASNINAIVCLDSSLAIPTFNNPNCTGSGDLVIKIVWISHLESAESQLGSNNYIIFPLAKR
jgi:Tfp pilus assembly protein PilV